jgi:hypothetical protein
MKADTFAKLVVLETLIDAEIGHHLERGADTTDSLREHLVARISDLVDEIDALDSVAAARTYDAIVDFLSELPDDGGGMVESTIRFRRAVDRLIRRGMEPRDLAQAATWAVVLDELLEALGNAYHNAIRPNGEVRRHAYLRSLTLLARAREVSERMLWEAGEYAEPELRSEMERLTFAVRHQRLQPTEVDYLIRAPQRRAQAMRPSTLTRVGSFVLRQLLRREPRRPAGAPAADPGERRPRRKGDEA